MSNQHSITSDEKRKQRTCADCPADITHTHGNTQRCKPCAARWRETYPQAPSRRQNNLRCETCNADITGRRANARFCPACVEVRHLEQARERANRRTNFDRKKEYARSRARELLKAKGIDKPSKQLLKQEVEARLAQLQVIQSQPRFCKLCPADISHRGLSAIYCEDCYHKNNSDYRRTYNRGYYQQNKEKYSKPKNKVGKKR